MKLFDKLDRYLVDNVYRITIEGRKIHVINYEEIVDFSSKQVIIKYNGVKTFIWGNDLVMSKMVDDEILITGELDKIEYK